VGAIDVSEVTFTLPDGRVLLDRASFRIGDRDHVALVGANGAGKTTLLRMVAGDEVPSSGGIHTEGRLGVMRQFIGSIRDGRTVEDLLLELSTQAVRDAAARLQRAEELAETDGSDEAGMRLAAAHTGWGDAGGWDAEVLWDACTTIALRQGFSEARRRPLSQLSGGEQKRLALEALLRGEDEVLILDEPDNYLDIPTKEWLAEALSSSLKTILFVTHDRQLLADVATKIVTIEGQTAWVHGGGFDSYDEEREARRSRLDAEFARYQEERKRLKKLLVEYRVRSTISEKFAPRVRETQRRIERHDQVGAPTRIQDQSIDVRLAGGRTGKRAVRIEQLELLGLTDPFSIEIDAGDRVAVVGPNGTGKSHFLRVLAGGAVDHAGTAVLGANVVAGHFSQTHEHPELEGMAIVDTIARGPADRNRAIGALRRYELAAAADRSFDTLSGGQQARLQILLLELGGATLLLLDEPTDNLDLESAEALEQGLAAFEGTVISVSHDRWFLKSFDRFLVFDRDGSVVELDEPIFT
jgi:ATPase subunit of ABC transporter with duplicated ATPase domains